MIPVELSEHMDALHEEIETLLERFKEVCTQALNKETEFEVAEAQEAFTILAHQKTKNVSAAKMEARINTYQSRLDANSAAADFQAMKERLKWLHAQWSMDMTKLGHSRDSLRNQVEFHNPSITPYQGKEVK